MKTTPCLTAPLALAFCVALGFPATAQNAPLPAPLPPPASPRTVSIELKSGTLGELVDLLRRETMQSILLPDEFRRLPLPEVFLRNVDAVSALQAVDQLVPEMLVNLITDKDGNPIIYITSGLPPAPSTRKISRVFKSSSREALKPEELDQFIMKVISASELACEVIAEVQGRSTAKPPVIRAHSGTGLLIVAGDEEDVQLIGQIIAGLGGEALPLGNSDGGTKGLRIEADTMTFDSKGNILKLQQGSGPRASVVEVPATASEKTLKHTQEAFLERLNEAAKILERNVTQKEAQAALELMKDRNRKAEENFRNQTETDPPNVPKGK
jgi:hypothetical protein